jgi:hypothetical protein
MTDGSFVHELRKCYCVEEEQAFEISHGYHFGGRIEALEAL